MNSFPKRLSLISNSGGVRGGGAHTLDRRLHTLDRGVSPLDAKIEPIPEVEQTIFTTKCIMKRFIVKIASKCNNFIQNTVLILSSNRQLFSNFRLTRPRRKWTHLSNTKPPVCLIPKQASFQIVSARSRVLWYYTRRKRAVLTVSLWASITTSGLKKK